MVGDHAGAVVSHCVLAVLRWRAAAGDLDLAALPPDHSWHTGTDSCF
jgi:hypothetical protein